MSLSAIVSGDVYCNMTLWRTGDCSGNVLYKSVFYITSHYDTCTICYFNMCWIANISQLNLPHGTVWLALMPSVLWRCWLGGRKGIRPVKSKWWGADVVICLEWGADLHIAQLMLLPLTVCSFSKIQIGIPFCFRLIQVVLDKGPLNGCVWCSNRWPWMTFILLYLCINTNNDNLCMNKLLFLVDLMLFVTCQVVSRWSMSVVGLATAAGCQLVASCDIAVASEKATFATPGCEFFCKYFIFITHTFV